MSNLPCGCSDDHPMFETDTPLDHGLSPCERCVDLVEYEDDANWYPTTGLQFQLLCEKCGTLFNKPFITE